MENYNGYTNYETWNIALWLNSNERLHNLVKESKTKNYSDVQEMLREAGEIETPDQVAYDDSNLDIETLNRVIAEI